MPRIQTDHEGAGAEGTKLAQAKSWSISQSSKLAMLQLRHSFWPPRQSSLQSPQSDVLQRQAPPGRKILCHGHDTRGGRGLHQAETVAAFAAVEARDDWLPGTEKTEMASDSLN